MSAPGGLDVPRLKRVVGEFAKALDDSERPATLARLLREAQLEQAPGGPPPRDAGQVPGGPAGCLAADQR